MKSPKQALTLLPFTLDHIEHIITLMQELSAFFSKETIEYAQEKISTLQWFVAIQEHTLIWFILFEIIDQFKAKIYWMGVLPTYQHQWIGSILLKHTEDIVIPQWIKEIELLTLDEHKDYPGYAFTRNFYKKHGFEIKSSSMEEDVKILTMTKKI